MKKIKIRLIKNIWIAATVYIYGWSRSERAVKQVFNLHHWLYTLQKYVVCKSQVEVGHSLNFADFTDFL